MSLITLTRLSKDADPLRAPKEKACKECGNTKPLKRFKKSGKMKDGRENTCLDCSRDKSKEKDVKAAEYIKNFFDFNEPAF